MYTLPIHMLSCLRESAVLRRSRIMEALGGEYSLVTTILSSMLEFTVILPSNCSVSPWKRGWSRKGLPSPVLSVKERNQCV